MKRIKYLLKQLFPCSYVSSYRANGKKFVAVWKMLFGKVYGHKVWQVV